MQHEIRIGDVNFELENFGDFGGSWESYHFSQGADLFRRSVIPGGV